VRANPSLEAALSAWQKGQGLSGFRKEIGVALIAPEFCTREQTPR
jgi:hypothetical protein